LGGSTLVQQANGVQNGFVGAIHSRNLLLLLLLLGLGFLQKAYAKYSFLVCDDEEVGNM
jgi:hypothetical protein